MFKKKTKKSKYDIYDNKKDAFLSGYQEGVEDTIDTLIYFNSFSDDFLFNRVRDFVTKHKDSASFKEILSLL